MNLGSRRRNNTAELGDHGGHRALDAAPRARHRSHRVPRAAALPAIVLTLFMMTLFADMPSRSLAPRSPGQAPLHVSPMSFYRGITVGLLGFGDVANGSRPRAWCSVWSSVWRAATSARDQRRRAGRRPARSNATVVASAAGIFHPRLPRELPPWLTGPKGDGPRARGTARAAAIDHSRPAGALLRLRPYALLRRARQAREGALVTQMYESRNRERVLPDHHDGFIGMILVYQAGPADQARRPRLHDGRSHVHRAPRP